MSCWNMATCKQAPVTVLMKWDLYGHKPINLFLILARLFNFLIQIILGKKAQHLSIIWKLCVVKQKSKQVQKMYYKNKTFPIRKNSAECGFANNWHKTQKDRLFNIYMLTIKVLLKVFNLLCIFEKQRSIISILPINFWFKFQSSVAHPNNFILYCL